MDKVKSLSVDSKLRVRINEDNKVIYADDNFLQFTGLDISDIIYRDFAKICHSGEESPLRDIIVDQMHNKEETYFAIQGATADPETYYWGLVQSIKEMKNGKERYVWNIKMFPQSSAVYLEDLLNKVFEIHKNAGRDFAVKYLQGFLEDKGKTYEEFILDTLGISKKKLRKYFNI